MRALTITLLFSSSLLAAARSDVETWHTVQYDHPKGDPFYAFTQGQVRFNVSQACIYYYRITQGAGVKFNSWLDLEVHYAYIRDRPRTLDHFRRVNRYELEANPHFKLSDCIEVRFRNRLEFERRSTQHRVTTLARHRTMLIFKEHFATFRVSDELIYDVSSDLLTQNRFIPFEIVVKPRKGSTLSLFFMIRDSWTRNKEWRSYVFGSQLNF